MKKFNILLSTLAIFGIFIAACSSTKGSVSLTQQPTSITPQNTESLPNTGAENGSATPGTNNQQSATTAYPTVQPTLVATATQAYPTEQPTQALTTTQAIPTAQATQALTPTRSGSNPSTTNPQFDPGHLSNLMQLPVLDQSNQQVGTVKDLVLDLKNLKIEYIILNLTQSTNNSQQVIVPWSLFQMNTSGTQNSHTGTPENALIFNGDQQKLSGAPQFNPDTLPQIGQPAGNWDASVRSYWGIGSSANIPGTPVPSGTPIAGQQSENTGLQGVILASQVLAYHVDGPNGQHIAQVNDLILDPSTGNLQYVLITITGIPGLSSNEVVPVPLRALSWNPQNQTINLNVPPQVLLGAPKFTPGQLPSTITPNWDAKIRSFWQQYLQSQSP